VEGTRRITRKGLVGTIAALALLAGATLAAVTAAQPASHHARGGALSPAAAYLGVGEAQLRSEVRSGRSLAQIAASTPGRSAAGLIEAIVAARKSRLQAQLASLKTRVTAQVERGHTGRGARRASVVAGYLGLDRRALVAKLRSGMTLAQIADSTPGRTRAGLVAALVAARTKALAAKVAAGELTQAQEQRRLALLPQRLERLVERVRLRGARASRAHARRGRAQRPTVRIPSGS
jgi:hypothetical protein